jgi:hypothetical protein
MKEAHIMPMRSSIQTDKFKPSAPKSPATDQASALRWSRVENRDAGPRRRSRSLPPLAEDRSCNDHQHCSGDRGHLLLQINVICVLFFLIGTTAIVEHPDWFGYTPIATQSLAAR